MKFSKKNQLSSELLIVDGLWGVGKSVITELVSVFDNMECWNLEMPFDHIPILYEAQALDQDSAIAVIRNLFDELTYNMCISRSVNFRYKDRSSIFHHPKKYNYLLRMLEQDGDSSLRKISENKMIIPVATHTSSSNNDLFLRALGKRCKIIRCVRHPVFIVHHWADYIWRCQTDPRDFTLKIDYNGEDIPFFADGWEEEYLEANNLEKSIKSISLLTDSYNHNFHQMKKKYSKESILEVSFEEAVKNTDDTIALISKFINQDVNNKVYKKVKKRARLPRGTIRSDFGYAFTKNYSTKESVDQIEIKKRLGLIKNKIRPKYYHELVRLSGEYESR